MSKKNSINKYSIQDLAHSLIVHNRVAEDEYTLNYVIKHIKYSDDDYIMAFFRLSLELIDIEFSKRLEIVSAILDTMRKHDPSSWNTKDTSDTIYSSTSDTDKLYYSYFDDN